MTSAEKKEYITMARRTSNLARRLLAVVPVLSLVVIICVFWWLKLTGITMAGEAFCGMDEHTHTDTCVTEELHCTLDHDHTEECYGVTYSCGLTEHIHDSTCYSDIDADVESASDWEMTLPDVSLINDTSDRIVAVARSQLGYTESTLNFQVDSLGVRHGYTRYGEWYGNPYGEWSAMFTAFCLHYAGVDDVPVNSGADAMLGEWDTMSRFLTSDEYSPVNGDVVFLDKNANGSADAVAILTDINADRLIVIEGDVDGTVAETEYATDDAVILGYGISSPPNNISLMADSVGNFVGNAVTYNANIFSSHETFVVYTVGSDGVYYALDGNANAVKVSVDSSGVMTADVEDVTTLYWTFEYCGTYDNRTSYYIRNQATQMYLHPYINSSSDKGAILTGRWETALYPSGDGVKLRGARQNAYASIVDNSSFSCVDTLNSGTTFYFGTAPEMCNVWLDGTNGGLMSYSGSLDKGYSFTEGEVMTLPTQWQSPGKYGYSLRGWFDIINKKYYAPGAQVTVTSDMVFYADWMANTYDIGQFNSQTVNTLSTENFVTVRMFDYGVLFNLLSESVSVNVSASGHTETWSLLTSGNNQYNGEPTLDFIFRDWDRGSEDISYPQNHNSKNNPTNSGSVYSGLYTEELGELLFSTDNSFDPSDGSGVIGKQYLGEGDHLFQLMTDPTSEHYGYYYYDSDRNAASYNQSENRFYVYDYLECTKDSATSNDAVGKYSDFLPLNSPYANTNGKNVTTYTYDGTYGEYVGTNHCMYDAKYSDSNNSPDNVAANFWFGMSVDIDFYLPNSPGYVESDGSYGNKDIYGKDIHFKFSGDDDVWVFVDGRLVLDLGGIHGVESGDVNFSSGIVTVNGTQTDTIYDIEPGEHVLTIYYLERGSSRSNCAIYFNLAPRFSLSIEKEDVLTGEKLNGAEFSVYTDRECTVPAKLWTDEDAYNRGEPETNVFTVVDGVADMWGFGAGNTYYIKETKPPDSDGYNLARGVICLSLDKNGVASYGVEIVDETDEYGNVYSPSNGFTVHGFRIDEDTQEAFIIVTNAQDWVTKTTTVQVMKQWADTEDHTYDAVAVYLTVTDPDGTIRRIREIELSEANDWEYIWTSLPKYAQDGVTEIVYGVEESYVSGYYGQVEKIDEIIVTNTTWAEALTFENGGTYILKYGDGYLASNSATSDAFGFVDEYTAKNSPRALWTATVNGTDLRLTNGEGQVLSFNYSSSSSSRYFYAVNGNATYQTLRFLDSGSGLRLYCVRSNRNYYFGTLKTNGRANATTSSGSAISFTPYIRLTETTVEKLEDTTYQVTNIPLDEVTSLTVNKVWDIESDKVELYEQLQINVMLMANGEFAGRTLTLSLKNGWTDTFDGLPYKDSDGNVIEYTVVESIDTDDWIPLYGESLTVDTGADVPSYSMTVTNSYRKKYGAELPATGGYGKNPYILCGAVLMLTSLVCGCILRRKRKGGNSS